MLGRALTSHLGKVLGTMLVIGMAGSTVTYGTFATFTASTSNANTFATGTLVLSNKVNTGSACLSTGSGVNTNAHACDTAFTVSALRPGATAQTADIVIKNEGTLNATALKAYAASACANSNSGTVNGTGDLCAAIRLTVQEYTDNTYATPSTCHFGGAACALDATKTLATYPLSGAAINMGALNSAASRYFRLTVELPSTAGNDLMGRQAAVAFTWLAE
jgi:hypothetical protein